ncbi:MAG: type VI secretion system protein ImpL [Halieaceae bacterium]|jgi:type VI secretion system protein ImpL
MKVFRDARFWIGLGLICLLLATWVGSGFLKAGDPPASLSWPARTLILLVITLIVLGVYGLARMGARRTNSRVIEEMTGDDPSIDQANLTDEEQRLQDKFRSASQHIKGQQFGARGKRVHLYELPWYVVIGSPGSGKTTAIRQSGLEFPLEELTQGASIGGVGGTRNCDWWITEQAVLLDTAGRYTTQDSDAGRDSKGWKNFLALLRKHRKRQPINGAILVLSTEELLNMNDEQWRNHASTIARRLRELTKELQMNFPVYLMVTKVDLLAGCREFFDHLDSEDEEQIWGTTLSLELGTQELQGDLRDLVARLHQQMPAKLRYERDVRRRRAIYSFPWQLDAVAARVEQFVTEVFSQGDLRDSATLRGVYLSSAVQEGTPIEKLVGGVASGFGISGGQISSAATQSRSLFLRKLFPQVVFQESFLAGTNNAYERRIRRLRAVAFAGIIALGVGLAVVWSSAFGVHKTLIGDAKANITDFEESPRGLDRSLIENLYALQYLESATSVFDSQEHPWLGSLGMYDDSIDDASDAAYLRAVAALVAPSLAARAIGNVEAGNGASFQERFDSLKAYLMLAMPEHRDNSWLTSWITTTPLAGLEEPVREEAARHLLNLLIEQEDYALDTYDEDAVQRSRDRLIRVSQGRQLYSKLKAESGTGTIDLSGDLGPYFNTVFEDAGDDTLTVQRLYTLAGYKDSSFGLQADWVLSWMGDRWVLGEGSQPSPVELARAVEESKGLYARDYINQWQNVLTGVDLKAIDSTRLPIVLRHLSEPALSPMSMLLNLVASETSLPETGGSEEAATLAGEVLRRKGGVLGRNLDRLSRLAPDIDVVDIPETVDSAFSEYGYMLDGESASKNARLLREIAELRQWLARGAKGNEPVDQLLQTAEELPTPFSDWTINIAQAVRGSAGANRMASVNKLWRREVAQSCNEAFRGRFPFTGDAERDVPIIDFEEFFAPGGIEERFVADELAPMLSENRSQFSKSTLWTIRQGERVRDAFFASGTSAGFAYQLTSVEVDDSIAQVFIESGDGQSVRYRHGPPVPMELNWPDGKRGITVTFVLEDGSRRTQTIPGPWAIFRLADTGGASASSDANNQFITLTEGTHRAVFRLSTDTGVSPFYPGLLSKYQCRDSL